MGEDLRRIAKDLRKRIKEMEKKKEEDLKEINMKIEEKEKKKENDLRKIIKKMEEKKEEDLKKKLELINKLFLLSSSLALIIGSLWFLIYLILIVKDFPPSTEKSLFYYIFVISIYLIISLVSPLVLIFILRFKDNEENISGKIRDICDETREDISKEDKNIITKFINIIINIILIDIILHNIIRVKNFKIFILWLVYIFINLMLILYI
jgi:Sec-independent protein translocase protein TatA